MLNGICIGRHTLHTTYITKHFLSGLLRFEASIMSIIVKQNLFDFQPPHFFSSFPLLNFLFSSQGPLSYLIYYDSTNFDVNKSQNRRRVSLFFLSYMALKQWFVSLCTLQIQRVKDTQTILFDASYFQVFHLLLTERTRPKGKKKTFFLCYLFVSIVWVNVCVCLFATKSLS